MTSVAHPVVTVRMYGSWDVYFSPAQTVCHFARSARGTEKYSFVPYEARIVDSCSDVPNLCVFAGSERLRLFSKLTEGIWAHDHGNVVIHLFPGIVETSNAESTWALALQRGEMLAAELEKNGVPAGNIALDVNLHPTRFADTLEQSEPKESMPSRGRCEDFRDWISFLEVDTVTMATLKEDDPRAVGAKAACHKHRTECAEVKCLRHEDLERLGRAVVTVGSEDFDHVTEELWLGRALPSDQLAAIRHVAKHADEGRSAHDAELASNQVDLSPSCAPFLVDVGSVSIDVDGRSQHFFRDGCMPANASRLESYVWSGLKAGCRFDAPPPKPVR